LPGNGNNSRRAILGVVTGTWVALACSRFKRSSRWILSIALIWITGHLATSLTLTRRAADIVTSLPYSPPAILFRLNKRQTLAPVTVSINGARPKVKPTWSWRAARTCSSFDARDPKRVAWVVAAAYLSSCGNANSVTRIK
jgi:hypothetical protein